MTIPKGRIQPNTKKLQILYQKMAWNGLFGDGSKVMILGVGFWGQAPGSGRVITACFGPWGGLVGGGFNLPINQSTKDTTWIQSTNQPKTRSKVPMPFRRLEVIGVTIYNGTRKVSFLACGTPLTGGRRIYIYIYIYMCI